MELDRISGVNYSRISRIERGEGADEDTFTALCKALDLVFYPSLISQRRYAERF